MEFAVIAPSHTSTTEATRPSTGSDNATTPNGHVLTSDRQTSTAQELQHASQTLRRADYGIVHPELSGIRARRGEHQSAADYHDFVLDARRSTNTLMNKPAGQSMLAEINQHTTRLNPNQTETAKHPLTVVDIHSGPSNTHRARTDPGDFTSAEPAYRYDGKPGQGRASRICYNEQEPSSNRFIGEGHEMVHAWRAAHGVAVSSAMLGPRHADPLYKQPWDTEGAARKIMDDKLLYKEEFETVGLQQTPRSPNAPTENRIRAEHNRPVRNDYSGVIPTSSRYTEDFKVLDEATDDRFALTKPFTDSPAENLWKHYTK